MNKLSDVYSGKSTTQEEVLPAPVPAPVTPEKVDEKKKVKEQESKDILTEIVDLIPPTPEKEKLLSGQEEQLPPSA